MGAHPGVGRLLQERAAQVRRVAAEILLTLALGGCSSGLALHDQSDGSCIQTRTRRFLGIPYSSSDYRVNCGSQ
jgi:hypothetical protein